MVALAWAGLFESSEAKQRVRTGGALLLAGPGVSLRLTHGLSLATWPVHEPFLAQILLAGGQIPQTQLEVFDLRETHAEPSEPSEAGCL